MGHWLDEYWRKRPPVECPICGKKYIPAPEHAWKIGPTKERDGSRPTLVCSYTCMRVWEKEMERKEKERIARKEKLEYERKLKNDRKAYAKKKDKNS